MIFEVEDLKHASPSTVSRCGVVYIEPGIVEYENIIRVFLDKHLNGILPQEQIDHIKKWVVIASAKGFPYVERMCKTVIPLKPAHMAL